MTKLHRHQILQVSNAYVESLLFLGGQLVADLTKLLDDVVSLCGQLLTLVMTFTQLLHQR